MPRTHSHILSLLLLAALLPMTLLASHKKGDAAAQTSLLSLDEQHYFDSLYFKALTLQQCAMSDSATTLMQQAVQFYDSLLESRHYRVLTKLPNEDKQLEKGFRSPTTQQAPGLAAAYFFLSNQYRRQNNALLTMLTLSNAVAIDSVNYWYTDSQGSLFLAMDRIDDARSCYERLVRLYPEKSDPLYDLAMIYRQIDSIDMSLATLDRIEELEGVNPQLTQYKFSMLQEDGRTEEGFDQYRKLIARYPYNVQYRIQMGDLQMQNGQIPQAKQTYDAAAAVDPDNSYVWIALANYYSMTGDQPAADSLVAAALVNANQDVDTKVKVMNEYLKGSYRKLSQYRSQVEQGNIYSELDTMQLFHNVDSLFTLVSTMYPTADEIYNLQADWRSAMGQDSLAYESMRFATDLKPTSQDYYEKRLYYTVSWMSKADIISLTQQIEEQFAACQTAYLVGAWAYVQQEDYPSAIAQYQKAIDNMSPPDANQVSQLWGSMGDLYHLQHDTVQTFECYEKAVKYNPTNYSVLNNYAYYLSIARQNLVKAEGMALKVIQKYPDNPTYLDTYAWILYLEGSYTLAIFYQQHAIDCLKPDDTDNSTLFDHYGDMLVKNNDLQGAVDQWRRALQCTDCDEPEKIQKKIDSAELLLK